MPRIVDKLELHIPFLRVDDEDIGLTLIRIVHHAFSMVIYYALKTTINTSKCKLEPNSVKHFESTKN